MAPGRKINGHLRYWNALRVARQMAQPGIHVTCPSCGTSRFVPASNPDRYVLRCKGVTPAGRLCNHARKIASWRLLGKPPERFAVIDALWAAAKRRGGDRCPGGGVGWGGVGCGAPGADGKGWGGAWVGVGGVAPAAEWGTGGGIE